MSDEPDKSEKTEEPTQKKLDDAIKKGDVAKSQEVSTWFVMVGITGLIATLAPGMASGTATFVRGFLEKAHAIPTDPASLVLMLQDVLLSLLGVILLPLLLIAALALAGNIIQHPFVWSYESIKPKLSKISPLSGAKRLFSKQSLVNFAKGLAKISLVATVMAVVLWPDRDRMDTMITADPILLLDIAKDEVLKVMLFVLALLLIIAAADYAYQRHQWHEKQKMTLKEVRDEFKQMEGDPTVKSKIRQIRQERARGNMMGQVPDASVVLTNPTHYAVALKYDDTMQAPVCVAKGTDLIALKIREIAKENNVPIVENPPLARALHASVDLEDMIPEEHFAAVANVIGYVMQLKQKQSWKSR